ncbi:MAG: hypothetical protein IPL28_18040 [Chloroflexi bacterium]|nr:hypothetical protein [Chloroflexota bacterium]
MKIEIHNFVQLEQLKLELSELHGRLQEAQHLRLTTENQYQISRAVVILCVPLALISEVAPLGMLIALFTAALAFRTYRLLGELSADLEKISTAVQAKQAQIRAALAQLEQGAAY